MTLPTTPLIGEELQPVLSRFSQFNDYTRQQQAAGEIAAPLFDGPIATVRRLLDGMVTDPRIAAQLRQELTSVDNGQTALDYLGAQATGLVANADLESTAATLEARREAPLYRLAALYRDALEDSPAGSAPKKEAAIDDNSTAEQLAACAFLAQDVTAVAAALEGMQLQLGDSDPVMILVTRPQDTDHNKHFLNSRPIFGPDRDDVYVAAVRGRFMIFVAAGDPAKATDCVAIMGARHADGSESDKPTKVAHSLGLDREQIGKAYLKDNTLTLVLKDR